MKHIVILAAGLVGISSYAYADTSYSHSVEKDNAGNYRSTTVREDAAPAAPVAPATVSTRTEVERSDGMGDSRKVVTEKTNVVPAPADVVPSAGVASTKSAEVTETNAFGDTRKVKASRTVNANGNMVQEEYHEKTNY